MHIYFILDLVLRRLMRSDAHKLCPGLSIAQADLSDAHKLWLGLNIVQAD